MQWFLMDRLLLAIGRLLLATIICLMLYEISPAHRYIFNPSFHTGAFDQTKVMLQQMRDAQVYRLWLIFHLGCLWLFVLCLSHWLQPLRRLTEQQVRVERL